MSPDESRSVSLSLSRGERWTLHHVLLDRLQRRDGAGDPPPAELRRAFETLDGGGTRFTIAELRALRELLAAYHHSTSWWEVERPRIERLLDRVTDATGSDRPPAR